MELVGPGPVALDSAIFIYFLAKDPACIEHVVRLFEAIDGGRLFAVTSAITLLEVLVVPYRARNIALAERYEALLRQSRGLTLVHLALPQLRLAAQVRADLGIRTPDALQVAPGLSAECTNLVTNDRRIPASVGGMSILQLSQIIPRPDEAPTPWVPRLGT